MISWRAGVVTAIEPGWSGVQTLTVMVDDHPIRALSYPDLVGELPIGAEVLLNVSAQVRGLGTGGYALVVSRTDQVTPDGEPGPGHLVKARYTPLQAMVLGVDEQESDYHHVLADADDLEGMPVVVADLHSALPAVIAGIRRQEASVGRHLKIAYIWTDGGALPAWFSKTVAVLREVGWIDTCITVGQAFGGDLEAVTVHTGLLAARYVAQADIAVVAQGPGNLGTGTRWGFSGVAVGDAVNAISVLGGRAVASLRVSGADPRERHRGISHHSLTAYGRVALRPADVVVPRMSGPLSELSDLISQQAEPLASLHKLVTMTCDDGLLADLAATPVRLSTMGRGLDQDPASFLAAAVAGMHAVDLVTGNTR